MPSTILRTDNSANMSGIKPVVSAGQPEQVFHYKYAIEIKLFKCSVTMRILSATCRTNMNVKTVSERIAMPKRSKNALLFKRALNVI